MRMLIGLALMAAIPAAAHAAPTIDLEWQQRIIRVASVDRVNQQLDTSTSRGVAAARLEQLLTAADGSAERLEEELAVFGTGPDEQEALFFADDPSAGARPSLLLGVVSDLTAGQRYRFTFSYVDGTPDLPPDEYGEFAYDAPIREIGNHDLQQLVTASFTAPMSRSPYFFFIIGRPAKIPETFGLSQLNLSPVSVPEPATWALMIGGIGLVGGSLRRRGQVRTNISFA